jgi:Rod binding domain-containing protein
MLTLVAANAAPSRPSNPQADAVQPELRQAFQEFVAGTFYKQMLGAMRKTHGEAAYMHGGQAERVFQGQLDQQVAEDMAKRQGAALTGSLFAAFQQQFTGRIPGRVTKPTEPVEKLPAPARLAAEDYAEVRL